MRLNSEYNGDQFKPFQNHAKTLLVSSDGPASRFAACDSEPRVSHMSAKHDGLTVYSFDRRDNYRPFYLSGGPPG
jgi:hypothetical protein